MIFRVLCSFWARVAFASLVLFGDLSCLVSKARAALFHVLGSKEARVNIMASRTISKVDIGFDVGSIVWALLNS